MTKYIHSKKGGNELKERRECGEKEGMEGRMVMMRDRGKQARTQGGASGHLHPLAIPGSAGAPPGDLK